MEEKQGHGRDDTAANGLRIMFCHYYLKNWRIRARWRLITSAVGNWGTWQGMKMCPRGTYIVGARVRFEDRQGSGGDDTALNGLQIDCRDKYQTKTGKKITVALGYWGEWKDWVYFEKGKLARYVRCREEKKLTRGDDTALNGIQFKVE